MIQQAAGGGEYQFFNTGHTKRYVQITHCSLLACLGNTYFQEPFAVMSHLLLHCLEMRSVHLVSWCLVLTYLGMFVVGFSNQKDTWRLKWRYKVWHFCVCKFGTCCSSALKEDCVVSCRVQMPCEECQFYFTITITWHSSWLGKVILLKSGVQLLGNLLFQINPVVCDCHRLQLHITGYCSIITQKQLFANDAMLK